MTDLAALFDTLVGPSAPRLPHVSSVEFGGAGVEMTARPLPEAGEHRLARLSDGSPALLLAVRGGHGGVRPAPVVLEHLCVRYDVPCRIRRPDGEVEEGAFTIVACTQADRALISYFLHAVGATMLGLGHRPLREEITRAVNGLVELFRSLAQPSRKSVQGLWSEMLLIVNARDPGALVRAWHAMPEDRYDFNAGPERIEVKSASSRVRQHHFSLEQLLPPPGTRVLIASLFVERAGAGTSLYELADELRTFMGDNADLLLKIDRVMVQTLGQSLLQALEERFDRQLAESSLAFYEPDDVPSVDPHLPTGVSEVNFKTDLTNVLTVNQAHRQGGLFDALSQ